MEVRQLQNLLQYLGYYEGRVDGISGPMTEPNTRALTDARARLPLISANSPTAFPSLP